MSQQKDIYDYLVLILPVLGALGGVFLAGWFGNKSSKQQLNCEKQKENVPILLQLLNDLKSLEEFFVFNGKFCPSLEHRMPELSMVDGDGINTMSFAQREHQFRKIGSRIIENCRRIIFINSKKSLPSLLELCKEIIEYLQKTKAGQKQNVQIMITHIVSRLAHETLDQAIVSSCRDFANKLRTFQETLETQIEAELPTLPERR